MVVDAGQGRDSWRGGSVSVSVRVAGVAGVECFLALLACLLDQPVVDGIRGVVVQSAVAVVGVVTGEEGR